MTDRLVIIDDEYVVSETDVEEWTGTTIQGTGELNVQGELHLVDDATTPEEFGAVGDAPVSLPGGITIPFEIQSLGMISTGFSVFLVGTMAILGALTVSTRNFFAGVPYVFAWIALILAGTMGLELSWFYALVVGTAVMLVVGMVARAMYD